MINQELEQNLNNAFKLAQDQKHEFVTVEHLLLALLENSDAIALLTSNKVNIEQLRVDLQEFIGSTTPKISKETEIDIQPTLGFQRVLQRAVFHVQSSGKQEVTGANVLVAIFSEQESQAVYFLKQQVVRSRARTPKQPRPWRPIFRPWRARSPLRLYN